jgi:hypothetical protein
MESFQVVMQFLMMPMLFLSGALFTTSRSGEVTPGPSRAR